MLNYGANTDTGFTFECMAADSGNIQLSHGNMHYLKSGSGKKLLLAFHGYGNNASLFLPFAPYLDQDFTMVSFDLPHHGESQWQQHGFFSKEDLRQLARFAMKEFGVTVFSLIGYSMGGRVCLTLMEMMPAHVERCVLIASDGLVFNPLYFFVTRTFLGRSIFKNFLGMPKRYLNFMEWLRKKEWVDAARHKFAMHYLASEKDRLLLLQVWPAMSHIVANKRRLRAAIRSYKIPVCIFMGSYDKVIPPHHAQAFKKDLNTVKLFILEKGHRAFDTETMPQIAQCLTEGKC